MSSRTNVMEVVDVADPVGDSVDMVPSRADGFADLRQDPADPTTWPRHEAYRVAKLIGEWLVALVLFIVSAPLMLILAAAVKLSSPGPAFYSQTRLGRGGRKYQILKLRTMVQNAEAGTGAVWAARQDNRITTIGKVLRKTHLDELPQLLNVLRGDMGLIGPRPERPEIAERIERHVPAFRHRLLVRPGITGLAQMLLPADDPNDTEFRGVRQKLAHDLYYVRELGPLLDLRIAISTPCYFAAALIDGVRRGMLGRYGRDVEQTQCGNSVDERAPACGKISNASPLRA